MKSKKVEAIVKKTIEQMNSNAPATPTMSDKEFCDACHSLIHAARLSSNLKPSAIDFKLSKMVIDKFSPTCKECKEAGERIKNMPEKKGFFGKLLDIGGEE